MPQYLSTGLWTMNARDIAQEILSHYQAHLDPYAPHFQNVRTCLQGPVLAMTQSLLSPSPPRRLPEEEKKCGDTSRTNSTDGNGSDSSAKISSQSCLDKTLWRTTASDESHQRAYESLGRRTQARMDAFLLAVSIAVADEIQGSPVQSNTESSSNNNNRVQQHLPPSKATKKKHNKQHNTKSNGTPNSTAVKKVHVSSSSPVLTSLNNHGKAFLRSVSDKGAMQRRKQPQILEQGLFVRLELYIRSLYRVRSLGRECVVGEEPPRAVDARVQFIVAAFVSTVGCVRSMSPVLTRLLTCLTKELLAVEVLGEELVTVIGRIVSEYEHGTSFASLAFLSSPEATADAKLSPLVLRYIRYLQSDWKYLERECELERMLSQCLDPHMRLFFKTVEFQSIGHLLEAAQFHRNELQTIELPPSAPIYDNVSGILHSDEAVQQAIRDLQREVITINGQMLPPVTSRSDLITLLTQSLNSRALTAAAAAGGGKKVSAHKRRESCPSYISTDRSSNSIDDSLDESLGHDGDKEASINPSPKRKSDQKRKPNSPRQSIFHVNTIDLLTRRLLIAASRTGTGGDAYFIVRDLFGGEDVEVVPSKSLPNHVRATRSGSIEIIVRLASVTIKCHGSFDIYPKSLVGCCEPLIQLHTTSSETIYLQEIRSSDSVCSGDENGKPRGLEDDGSSDDGENMVLQERQTNKTGWRVLAIRPALYEKVQSWNTPS